MGIAPAELLQKVPPHNDEAEAAVLGGILLESSVLDRVAEILVPEDFYHAAHREIFRAMIELARRGEFDVISLSDFLETAGKLEAVGGRTYIHGLLERAYSIEAVPKHARIVAEKSLLRSLIRVSGDIMGRCYEETGAEVDELVSRAERELLEVTQRQIKSGFVSMQQVANDSYDLLEAQQKAHAEGKMVGIHTGFRKLDELTLGFQPANLVIVAARPGMGKTSFALNVAEYVGVTLKQTVAFFSLEMSREELGIRMLCSRARQDQRQVRRGFVKDPWTTLHAAASVLADAPIFIDDSPVIELSEIRSKCRRLAVERGLALVLIDYLQLIAPAGGKRYTSREREVAEISRGLKSLAKELNIPVVVVAQLNRQVEMMADKRPTLAHLRESGALEQDADLVLFLYRREVYFPDEQEAKGKAEVILSKNRHGPIGSVPLAYIATLTRFENLAEDDPYWAPPPKPPGSGMPDLPPTGDDEAPF